MRPSGLLLILPWSRHPNLQHWKDTIQKWTRSSSKNQPPAELRVGFREKFFHQCSRIEVLIDYYLFFFYPNQKKPTHEFLCSLVHCKSKKTQLISWPRMSANSLSRKDFFTAAFERYRWEHSPQGQSVREQAYRHRHAHHPYLHPLVPLGPPKTHPTSPTPARKGLEMLSLF